MNLLTYRVIALLFLLISSLALYHRLARSSITLLPLSRFYEDSDAVNWVSIAIDDHVRLKRYPSNKAKTLASERHFSQSCLDAWISRRELDCPHAQFSAVKLDVAYSYIDGNDPLQILMRAPYTNAKKVGRVAIGFLARHFRTHNELQYSLRSLIKAFDSNIKSLNKVTLFTSDIVNATHPNERLVYIPAFLNRSVLEHEQVRIEVAAPYNHFKSSHFTSDAKAKSWRENALPIFNSMAAESQIGNLDLSDNFIYSNDDFFFGRPLAMTDFYSPLYGPVLRLQTNLQVSSEKKGATPVNSQKREGEWPSLGYANWLISQKFGERVRYYPAHTVKTFNKAILQEIEQIWAEELADTASIRFRGSTSTEVNIGFLFMHYMIERHREALLWSLIVLKADRDGNGLLSETEISALLSILPELNIIPKNATDPSTANSAFEQVHLTAPLSTAYLSTSADGYLYPGAYGRPEALKEKLTTFKTEFRNMRAADVFKALAFQQRDLGSIIIRLLLQDNENLDIFLPPSVGAAHDIDREWTAVLPLSKTWEEADYSRQAILGNTHRFDWRMSCVRMLYRYSHVLGETNFKFIKLNHIASAHQELDPLMKSPQQIPALFVINDDYGPFIGKLDPYLKTVFSTLWPSRVGWEKVEDDSNG